MFRVGLRYIGVLRYPIVGVLASSGSFEKLSLKESNLLSILVRTLPFSLALGDEDCIDSYLMYLIASNIFVQLHGSLDILLRLVPTKLNLYLERATRCV